MIHNSSIEKYREPIGAVRLGEEVTLRLFDVPECSTGVELLYSHKNGSGSIDMEEDEDCYVCSLETIDKGIEVIWYYFKINEEGHYYFYGARPGRTCGEGMTVERDPYSFQLTIYDREFDTPRWMSKGIMYQIFPDRFYQGDPLNVKRGEAYHTSMGREVYIHKNWEEQPLFAPIHGNKFYNPCDYFGGDLAGIMDRLDDLIELGVNCIYLNPIVEADSNHRYNAADYKKVDPFLGDNEDFLRLCRVAKEKGIHIVVDGVFSHTGDDSVYFNKKGNYKEPGAFQGPHSPYYDWYSFEEDGTYKSWWGFQSLPEVNELNPSFERFIITNEDSVINHWIDLGASGFRLDVADELPDYFIFVMRNEIKKKHPDNVIIGEVWEDATTKESYGKKREYALGKGLDSVMNYPFKVNCVNYLLQYKNAYAMQEFLLGQQCNYPKPFYYAVMNLLSSHDIPRIRTTFASGMNDTLPSREKQIGYIITRQMDQKGYQLSRLALAMQFFIPGIPSIYYGDEYGMHGFMDPFNRGTFFKNDEVIYEDYRKMTKLRKENQVLQTGHALYFAVNENVLAILRFVVNDADVFHEECENGVYLLLVNPTNQVEDVSFDIEQQREGISDKLYNRLISYLDHTEYHERIEPYDYKILDLSHTKIWKK